MVSFWWLFNIIILMNSLTSYAHWFCISLTGCHVAWLVIDKLHVRHSHLIIYLIRHQRPCWTTHIQLETFLDGHLSLLIYLFLLWYLLSSLYNHFNLLIHILVRIGIHHDLILLLKRCCRLFLLDTRATCIVIDVLVQNVDIVYFVVGHLLDELTLSLRLDAWPILIGTCSRWWVTKWLVDAVDHRIARSEIAFVIELRPLCAGTTIHDG